MDSIQKVFIIDYGMGNPGSIKNMLHRIGCDATITNESKKIAQAKKLLLSGVGSFDQGMIQLKSTGLLDILNQKVLTEKTPILGICLGMQLFSFSSQEGNYPGLGWLNAQTVKFNPSQFQTKENLRIPHMGWNTLSRIESNPLIDIKDNSQRFYFAHSYHLFCQQNSDIKGWTYYGYEFPSLIVSDNIMGVQFHPEKSHKFGMKLLTNFLYNV